MANLAGQAMANHAADGNAPPNASRTSSRLEQHVPRKKWYTAEDPVADERRCAEARHLREAHEAQLVGAEPREQRRLKEMFRRASNGLRSRHVAAVALENKAKDIRQRQKRRTQLKPQLMDLFSSRRVPTELVQNILTFVGYDLVRADVTIHDLDDTRPMTPAVDAETQRSVAASQLESAALAASRDISLDEAWAAEMAVLPMPDTPAP